MPQDRRDGDGVDARLAPRLARGGFPDAVAARLVGPFDLVELGPFGFGGGEGRDAPDLGGLGRGGHGEGTGLEAGSLRWVEGSGGSACVEGEFCCCSE